MKLLLAGTLISLLSMGSVAAYSGPSTKAVLKRGPEMKKMKMTKSNKDVQLQQERMLNTSGKDATKKESTYHDEKSKSSDFEDTEEEEGEEEE